MNNNGYTPNTGVTAPIDPGWNDPPKYSYNAQTTPNKPRNILNKRVAFPLSSATASPVVMPPMNIPPMPSMMPPAPPPQIPNLKPEETNVDGENILKEVKEILLGQLENSTELGPKANDIKRRIGVMEDMWTSGKLNSAIFVQMQQLAYGHKKTQFPIRKREMTCRRRCRRWLFRKIKRCFKKRMFGDPDPKLADYEFVGMNLGSIRNKLTGRKSSIIENKIRISKLNRKDLEQIRKIKGEDLQKRFSVTESKLNTLGGMLTDYKKGNLSLAEVPRRRFDFLSRKKKLNKERLNEMLQEYEKAKRKRDLEDVQQNVKDLKKDITNKSKILILDRILEDLEKGKVSRPDLLKDKLDPKKLKKNEVDKMLTQYGHARAVENRGLSFLVSKSKTAFMSSKSKLQELLEDLKDFRLSEVISTIRTKVNDTKSRFIR